VAGPRPGHAEPDKGARTLPILWLVVIAVAGYLLFTLVTGALKLVVVVAAVAAAIWAVSRLFVRAR
jgi:hypothetical protein